MPISSLGGFGGQAGRDDRPVAKGDGRRVRSGLAAGGSWTRNFGSWSRDRQTVMGGGLLSKRERICRGTEGSNPSPSSGESRANPTSLIRAQRRVSAPNAE